MKAQSYVEWCELAGLYLRNESHFDRYRTYADQISPAGLNVVIVREFLDDNPHKDVSVTRWRANYVYEVPSEQQQRMVLTAAALEAIGAPRVAAAVRSSRSSSLYAVTLAALVPTATAPLSGRVFPDHESWEQIEQLLERYVAAHQTEFQADIDRHGDPRTVPGFTRERRLQELQRQHQRQLSGEEQLEDIGKLREYMATIVHKLGKAKKGGGGKVDSLRRKLLEVVKRNKRRPADEILPEMTAALAEVDAFVAAHPELAPPDSIGDDQLKTQLAALGDYDVETARRETSITWEDPIGFDCAWAEFSLNISFPTAQPAALQSVLQAIGRLKIRWPQLTAEWREQAIANFRNYEGQMLDDEREEYEQDAAGEVTEASILQHAGRGRIYLRALDAAGEGIYTETHFPVDWDLEHGLELEWDDEAVAGDATEPATFSTCNVQFVNSHRPLSTDDIANFEQRFGIQLPDVYRQFLLTHNGGHPQPNHVVFKRQGEKFPADVGRFFSITAGQPAPAPVESLEAALAAASSQALRATWLPIATIRFLGQVGAEMPAALSLILSGKREGYVVALGAERDAGIGTARMSEMVRKELAEFAVNTAFVVAKSLGELFGKLIERPRVAVPDWLRLIRENDLVGFVGWIEGGGNLHEEHTDYGAFRPSSVLEYLSREGSPALLRELLNRQAIKPKELCRHWQETSRDVARFRELMTVLPQSLWHRVLAADRVWDHPDLWEQLAAAGVDFNTALDRDGVLPIHLAVQRGSKVAVKWLIAHGADVHKPDKYQRTAFIWAEDGPGFECLPLLEGKDEIAAPVGESSPDAPGIAVLWHAAEQLATDVGLVISIQIKSPPVTRVEKMLCGECHYRLLIDVRGNKVTFRDMMTPRQDYLYAAEWPTFLFAPILQWPELRPLWETLEVREFDWAKARKKRNYEGPLRADLLDAARSALEQAFQPAEAAARGIRLRK